MKPWWLWLQLWPAGRGTNWGGGHFALLILMPDMFCILLLLSCQIVWLQAAGKKPTTSAACEGKSHSDNRQLSTALYVLKCSMFKLGYALLTTPQSVMSLWHHGLAHGHELHILIQSCFKGSMWRYGIIVNGLAFRIYLCMFSMNKCFLVLCFPFYVCVIAISLYTVTFTNLITFKYFNPLQCHNLPYHRS